MKKINVLCCIGIMGLLISSCSKSTSDSGSSSSYPYAVKMTDAPGPYDAVYVDIQSVEITGNDGKAVMANVHAGIYNLLDLSNGIDTLIASGTLGVSNIQQIRLILGSNNSVVVDSINYPLSTPSAEQSGLKIQVHQTLQAGVLFTILLDFDANKSIVDEGNGTYKLKPVIRTIDVTNSGNIKGKITPEGTSAFVTGTSVSGTSYSSNVTTEGNFMIKGLPPGVYSVTVTPALPLMPVTKASITVNTSTTTDVGTIVL